jgi:hypothetical protein
MTIYSNLPPKASVNDITKVIQYFDNYYTAPTELDVQSIDVLTGFLESKGFDIDAAKNISYIILKTAKESNYSVQQIIDGLREYDPIQLNDFLISLLNFNRAKTSALGTITKTLPIDHVKRNILA